jgi:murein DD-endopeptidase MepM/ murein hydrolase activator NlpD
MRLHGIALVVILALAVSHGNACENRQSQDKAGEVFIRSGLIEAARRDRIPQSVVDEFIRLQALLLDLDQPIVRSSSFSVLYEGEPAQLLAGTLSFGGGTDRLYRFTTDDGVTDYYDETGKSLRRALLRKPIPSGTLERPFGPDPKSNLTTIFHSGVDWAAPIGTAVLAAGDGVVEAAVWDGGRGNYLRLQHSDDYESIYEHLQAFAPDIIGGAHVRQGQVIGYVGDSGLVLDLYHPTMSYLHYQLLVKGRSVDPQRYKLPRSRDLDGSTLTHFERERDRFDALLGIAARPHELPVDTCDP